MEDIQIDVQAAPFQRLVELVMSHDELDTAGRSIGTSVRIPVSLREATGIAIDLGLVSSATEVTVEGIRATLRTRVRRAELDAHYRAHPDAKPSLAEVALATAELDGDPLMRRPELIQQAADRLVELRTDAEPHDVLLFAAGMAATDAA